MVACSRVLPVSLWKASTNPKTSRPPLAGFGRSRTVPTCTTRCGAVAPASCCHLVSSRERFSSSREAGTGRRSLFHFGLFAPLNKGCKGSSSAIGSGRYAAILESRSRSSCSGVLTPDFRKGAEVVAEALRGGVGWNMLELKHRGFDRPRCSTRSRAKIEIVPSQDGSKSLNQARLTAEVQEALSTKRLAPFAFL